jgi:diadenosine tetraphosphate (Ap4A) HIT family hydrolase
MDQCFSCTQNAASPAALPPREAIYDDGRWRVAHATGSSLPGWLVVVPRRHILSLSALTPGESTSLGDLLAELSGALEQGLGALKAYVIFFAEKEGFAHLHIHVVPRYRDLPPERRGPGVFQYLNQPPDQCIPPETMDEMALKLRPLLY